MLYAVTGGACPSQPRLDSQHCVQHASCVVIVCQKWRRMAERQNRWGQKKKETKKQGRRTGASHQTTPRRVRPISSLFVLCLATAFFFFWGLSPDFFSVFLRSTTKEEDLIVFHFQFPVPQARGTYRYLFVYPATAL